MTGDEKIPHLDPELQRRLIPMLNAFRQAGIPLMVVSGKRTVAHQMSLYAQGATRTINSRHLTGSAVDLGIVGVPARRTPASWWQIIGQHGERFGLRWGGRFSDYDPVHFDLG